MKKDCDCGCNIPTASTPESMLRFLEYRFNDGVAEGPAEYYQRDIRLILEKFYDAPRKLIEKIPEHQRWTYGTTKDERVFIQDSNFKNDARLYIDGDFKNSLDKLKYAVTITEILNKAKID